MVLQQEIVSCIADGFFSLYIFLMPVSFGHTMCMSCRAAPTSRGTEIQLAGHFHICANVIHKSFCEKATKYFKVFHTPSAATSWLARLRVITTPYKALTKWNAVHFCLVWENSIWEYILFLFCFVFIAISSWALFFHPSHADALTITWKRQLNSANKTSLITEIFC